MKLVVKNKTYEVIEHDKKLIRQIVHLSDIRIKKNDRIDEYMFVFDGLFQKLRSLQISNDETVIVVAGNIIEDKGELTGTSISLLKHLFLGLSSIATTVCIIGKQDLTNKDLNSISQVIDNAFTTKYPIHILLDDCIYEYNNILFGVTTMGATKVTPCEQIDGKITIGLYHGIVKGSKNYDNVDLAQRLLQNKTCYTVDDFKQYYDYTLLGNVPMHQYLDEEHTVLYAGSLVQQNYDESLFEHGFELIDIIENKTSFHKIKNKYGLLTVIIDKDDKSNIDFSLNYPENMGVKILCNAKDKNIADKICEDFEAKQIKIIERIDSYDYNGCMSDIKVGSNNVINLTGKPSIIKLISDFIKDKKIKNDPKFNINDTVRSRIMIKINDVLDDIEIKFNNGCKRIKLEYLEFENLMIYKDGNTIDFTKFEKVTGLGGTNNIGKSALIDILIYAIYGNCIRGYKPDIVRVGETNYNTTVRLDVNGKKYSITRKGTLRIKKKNGIKQPANDETITLVEYGKNPVTNKKEADEIINAKICPLDDLKRLSIILQDDTNSFITLDDKDKKDLICKYVGIDIFNTISCKFNTRASSVTKQMNAIKKNILESQKYGIDITKIPIAIKNELIKYKQQRDDTEIHLMNIIENITKCEIANAEFDFKINAIKANKSYNSKIRQGSIKDLEQLLKREQEIYMLIETEISSLGNELMNVIDLLHQFPNPDVMLKQFNDSKSDKINHHMMGLKDLYDKLVVCSNTKLDPKNVSVAEKKLLTNLNLQNNKINKLETDLQTINSQIIDIVHDNNLKARYNEYKTKLADKSDIESAINKLNTDREKHLKIAKELENYEYDPDCQYCVDNCMTKQKQFVDSSLKTITTDLNDRNASLQAVVDYLAVNSNTINQYEAMQNTIKENDINKTRSETLQLQLNKEKFQLDILKAEQIKINNDKKQLDAKKNNILVEKQINEIKAQIDEITKTSCVDYDMYLYFRNIQDTYKDQLVTSKDLLTEKSILIGNLKHQIIMTNENSDIAKEQQSLIIEITNLNRLKSDNLMELNILNNQVDELRENIREITRKYEEVMIINDKITTLKLQYDDLERDYNDYKIIGNIFGNNGEGIIDSLMSTTILPKLEIIINQIYKNIDGSQLSLSFDDGHFFIRRKTGGTQMYMNGGFVKHFGNMVFRMALMQINNHIKPNFMIIDEALDSSSKENKHLVIKLMEQLKHYYDFALIISHDVEIRSKYDHTITIDYDGSSSRINV